MQNYDFNFFDLRDDKVKFIYCLTKEIEKRLNEDCSNIGIKSIQMGGVDTRIGLGVNGTLNSTCITIYFNYIETYKVEEEIVPKGFWNTVLSWFKKPKYQTVYYPTPKNGKLIFSFNDKSDSDKWRPSTKHLHLT